LEVCNCAVERTGGALGPSQECTRLRNVWKRYNANTSSNELSVFEYHHLISRIHDGKVHPHIKVAKGANFKNVQLFEGSKSKFAGNIVSTAGCINEMC
jgi:hypothetical protein